MEVWHEIATHRTPFSLTQFGPLRVGTVAVRASMGQEARHAPLLFSQISLKACLQKRLSPSLAPTFFFQLGAKCVKFDEEVLFEVCAECTFPVMFFLKSGVPYLTDRPRRLWHFRICKSVTAFFFLFPIDLFFFPLLIVVA